MFTVSMWERMEKEIYIELVLCSKIYSFHKIHKCLIDGHLRTKIANVSFSQFLSDYWGISNVCDISSLACYLVKSGKIRFPNQWCSLSRDQSCVVYSKAVWIISFRSNLTTFKQFRCVQKKRKYCLSLWNVLQNFYS